MLILPPQHIHIVGIGGAGMSAIARVLAQKGYAVSGSDRTASALTRALADEGIVIYEGHAARNIAGADMLLVTSALAAGHVEVAAAHEAGIPVFKRADVIADVMRGQVGIAVGGAHGKTTTTSMIAHILIGAGHDPSYIIGGVLRSTGRNGGFGKGAAFVIEADEYDHMFLGLRPQIAAITNVEWDHPDFFPTPGAMHDAFSRFAALVPRDGLLIACADDEGARTIAAARAHAGTPVAYYGIDHPMASWRATGIRVTPTETRFAVERAGVYLGEARLRIPGQHNVLNALAALIAADTQEIAFADAAAALGTFEGAGRRFEVRGEADGVIVVDDYAHHPTAIRMTLAAARARYPSHHLWAVWQPHTYSRTHALLDDYALAFGAADHVLVTNIYAAREQPMPGVDCAAVVAAIQHEDVRCTPTLEDAAHELLRDVQSPAVIVIMSAGDAPEIGAMYLREKGL